MQATRCNLLRLLSLFRSPSQCGEALRWRIQWSSDSGARVLQSWFSALVQSCRAPPGSAEPRAGPALRSQLCTSAWWTVCGSALGFPYIHRAGWRKWLISHHKHAHAKGEAGKIYLKNGICWLFKWLSLRTFYIRSNLGVEICIWAPSVLPRRAVRQR